MLTLRREEKVAPTGLALWLPSTSAAEQQYATETLAEMGQELGTDCLVWLASLEDKKRHRRDLWTIVSGTSVALSVPLMIWSIFHTRVMGGLILPVVFMHLTKRPAKASRLQQATIERLVESGNSSALPALVDALWKPDEDLKAAAVRGLIRLLPLATNKTMFSERQWNLLLQEIAPPGFLSSKPDPNSGLVVAILKAIAATEYFPAIERVYKLSTPPDYPPTPWKGSVVQSVASECYAHLKQRRNEKAQGVRAHSYGPKL
ncbi:MAG: hypothetical protein V4671_26275 [Armatimonadota bacterium]